MRSCRRHRQRERRQAVHSDKVRRHRRAEGPVQVCNTARRRSYKTRPCGMSPPVPILFENYLRIVFLAFDGSCRHDFVRRCNYNEIKRTIALIRTVVTVGRLCSLPRPPRRDRPRVLRPRQGFRRRRTRRELHQVLHGRPLHRAEGEDTLSVYRSTLDYFTPR